MEAIVGFGGFSKDSHAVEVGIGVDVLGCALEAWLIVRFHQLVIMMGMH